jgi:hypothetical protein
MSFIGQFSERGRPGDRLYTLKGRCADARGTFAGITHRDHPRSFPLTDPAKKTTRPRRTARIIFRHAHDKVLTDALGSAATDCAARRAPVR